jgi:glycosyltransferase involved in cell wall biosynthesis
MRTGDARSPSATSTRVPVTVGILTYTSSIQCVEAAIRSALEFDDILLCDGGSTDGTRELASSLGCRIIDQAPEFLDGDGRLINEAGVNEQILAAASHDWVFFLDHDEELTPALVDEVRETVARSRTAGAYDVPRLYTLGGTVITCASVYPRYQARLVHRAAVVGYDGIVHAPVVLRDGERTERLTEPMLVPQPPLRELLPKWRGYLRLEESKKGHLSRSEWVEQVLRPQLRSVRWIAYRIVKVRRSCTGPRLPLRYEVSRVLYELATILYTGRRFVGFRRADPTRAWR